MDAEKLLGAFKPSEVQEIAGALPQDILAAAVAYRMNTGGPSAFSTAAVEEIAGALPADVVEAEAAHRGILVVKTAGPMAVRAESEEYQAAEAALERGPITRFLDPEVKISAEDQIAVMRKFWDKLGHEMPELSESQQAELAKVAEAHPLHRIVPTPLLSLAERKALAEKARVFPDQKFTTSANALWTPDESWVFGKLLRDPESTVKDGNKTYGLRYKTPEGETVGREAYVAALKAAGQAVDAKDGRVWTFPVMDVRVQAPRTRDYVRNLHGRVDPVGSPESLLTTQLLHQANGTPNPVWEVDFANEAVYELDRKGNPKALQRVASVYWDPDGRQVSLRSWFADSQYGSFGARGAESGLKT